MPDEVRLGTALPQDRGSELADGWSQASRAATVPGETAPGATAVFTVPMLAPDVERMTSVDEAFELVKEGHCWFGPEPELLTVSLEIHPEGSLEDTAMPEDSDPFDAEPPDRPEFDTGCGCVAGSRSGWGWLGLVALAGLVSRRGAASDQCSETPAP
jgi:hypothetical protein